MAAYDLKSVRGIEVFGGSTEAKRILARNGFVVSDPTFKQIFEPYITSPEVKKPSDKHPMGESLPSFITTDSAWHTYHVLLEEGVKNLEELQSERLIRFSQRLWNATKEKTGTNAALELFASVGLALQDEQHRKTLVPQQKRIVEGLRTGTSPVEVPIGFALAPVLFRAQSFYTQSPELSDYFAARQWYASVVFRLANARETRLALSLAHLVNSDPELLSLWKQLSDPLDTFLGPAEDGTIAQYLEAEKTVTGGAFPAGSPGDAQIAKIQKSLRARLPLPRVNDQQLAPEQYWEFGEETRGFRLLPPRRLPCAVCFQNTVAPLVPNRRYPSGLDFLAASPVLRSPAAIRAVESQFGKSVGDLILKTDCGPMPESLHGEAMQLIALLQKPLPGQAPSSMRNDAWQDLQLWTQLGAWAEQRHTWALHTKISVGVMGMVSPPKGLVSPYPEFFTGLARLSRRTAAAFKAGGLDQPFEVKSVATNLLRAIELSKAIARARDEKDWQKNSGGLEQLGQFQNRYYEEHKVELEKAGRDGWKKMEAQLETLARHCAESNKVSDADIATLRLFYEGRQNVGRLINEFAPVCDRLAELAKKALLGEALTAEDGKWIENYGITLASFHFYYANSYEVPLDNFPIVTRVFSNPLTDSMLYAGLARPQALYVIAPNGKDMQLYRGAVMTYREFVLPNEQLLDDESWRELISKGQNPPAPPFTRSFCAGTDIGELLKKLKKQSKSEDLDYGNISDTLWQIRSRATSNDLPALLELLASSTDSADSVTPDIAEIISPLNWEPYQAALVKMLPASDTILSDSAAQILLQRPGSLDVRKLLSDFASQSPRTRRLYCVLLSNAATETNAVADLLLRSARDADAGVRWQAVLAIGSTNLNDKRFTPALVECLKDQNELVAAASARSLACRAGTNAGPALLDELNTRLAAKRPGDDELRAQIQSITRDLARSSRPVGGYTVGLRGILDSENLTMRFGNRLPPQAREIAAKRLPPPPFDLPFDDFTLVEALIEALADMRHAPAVDLLFKLHGGAYDASASHALGRLAPDRLSAELLARVQDKQLDSYAREQAMVSMCKLSLTNCVRSLVPLLADETPIVYERSLPGPQWRVCDRAVVSIAIMLGWEHPLTLRYPQPEQREALMKRAREWAKSNP